MRFMITPTDSQTVTTTIESLKWLLHLVNKLPELVKKLTNPQNFYFFYKFVFHFLGFATY